MTKENALKIFEVVSKIDREAYAAAIKRRDERIAELTKRLQTALDLAAEYRAESDRWRDACVEAQQLAN